MPSTRDMSHAGQAADFLRHSAPIHRCDARGRTQREHANAGFWNRGGFVLTDDEVVRRAARQGWMPAEL